MTVEVHQAEFVDRVVEMPVQKKLQVQVASKVQKFVEVPQVCRCSTDLLMMPLDVILELS